MAYAASDDRDNNCGAVGLDDKGDESYEEHDAGHAEQSEDEDESVSRASSSFEDDLPYRLTNLSPGLYTKPIPKTTISLAPRLKLARDSIGFCK